MRVSNSFDSSSMEEVEEAVWGCEGNKCPGPDDFNFNFIKSCWNTIKDEIHQVLLQFHKNGKLPKAFTSSFVTIIGKTKNPRGLNEFRPISLIGCIYKIIAKILSSRLKGVFPGIIAPSQTAFLQRRQILDRVLVANEIINVAKNKKRRSAYMFKVDFEKTYDSESWKYLDYIYATKMGFGEMWRMWMSACIFSCSVSVLVNGNPTKEFDMDKGLRQEDPLAPFLFLIAAEGLSGLINKSIEASWLL